ncbi:MAG: hypothetical protein IKI84_02740, partial [Clostridia bacterium]|nr:hypothetical protein [Clostridia bacterium]
TCTKLCAPRFYKADSYWLIRAFRLKALRQAATMGTAYRAQSSLISCKTKVFSGFYCTQSLPFFRASATSGGKPSSRTSKSSSSR